MRQTIWDKAKEIISGFAWRIFLWSIDSTQEGYWREIYLQEQRRWHEEDREVEFIKKILSEDAINERRRRI